MDILRQFKSYQKEYYYKYDLQLFAKDGPNGEKTEEPTTKKLEDARKEGQVAKSQDIPVAASLLVFFFLLKVLMGFLSQRMLGIYRSVYSHIADYANDEFTSQFAGSVVGEQVIYILITIAPFVLTIYAITVVSQLVQVKWKVSGKPLQPKFSKINPLSGMKRLFSMEKVVELLKSVAKIGVIAYIIYDFLKDKWAVVMNMYSYSLPQAITLIGDILIDIGIRISIAFVVIAAADYFYQKWKFHEDMKMTKQEVKDEYKNSEGDPKVKSQQRARMQQASQRRMMQSVPEADVVITNPTHLAVAILYDKSKHEAPVVVAKGADYLAQRIKKVAGENSVEIVENKPLARMLYHNVEVGAEIPPELYQMVAEVLAYVYNLKGKI